MSTPTKRPVRDTHESPASNPNGTGSAPNGNDMTEEDFILHLAETTDASPKQIRDLILKHDGDRAAVTKDAKAIKAES